MRGGRIDAIIRQKEQEMGETVRLELYCGEDIPRLKRNIRVQRVLVWSLAGGTLALCVLFCCLCNAQNAVQMERAAIITSTVGGWLTIYRRLFGLQEAKYELQHAEHLLEAPRTALHGTLTVTKERLRIRNSIRIRILLLDDGGQIRRLKVNENRVRLLERELNGQPGTVWLADGYVAGIGGSDADD